MSVIIIRRSHVSIWKWVQGYSKLADIFRTDRRWVKQIFVDETLLKIDGHDYWLWVDYEPDQNKCLAIHISRERTILVCYRFFKHLRTRFGRKPILTDGAHWYNDACRWLRLPHHLYGTRLKNLMEERFIQQIKDRTECFDDHFPCRKEGCNRQHVWNWLKLFLLYLSMGADRIRFMTYLVMDGG